MKEQLVEMTGLSPRVIRVWFQNKRCKDKKVSIEHSISMFKNKNRSTKSHLDANAYASLYLYLSLIY